MSNSISGMDHSVAFTCLLDLYSWYGDADQRDATHATALLVGAWRERRSQGDTIDCHSLAKTMETELRRAVEDARANRLS